MTENSDREGSGTSEDALEDDDDEVNLELESLGLWNSQTQQQLFGADVDDIYNQPESPVESPAKRPRTRGRPKGSTGKRNPLNDEGRKLMGEANMYYISGELDKAIPLCIQVIRLSPNAPDGYKTLALIYRDQQQITKALRLYMIAAHLTPRDKELWKETAELSKTHGNLKQALYCYSKVLRLDPNWLECSWEKALILDQLGESKKAIDVLINISKQLPQNMEIVTEIARIYHLSLGWTQRAIDTIEEVYFDDLFHLRRLENE